jgi:hypothetical protein
MKFFPPSSGSMTQCRPANSTPPSFCVEIHGGEPRHGQRFGLICQGQRASDVMGGYSCQSSPSGAVRGNGFALRRSCCAASVHSPPGLAGRIGRRQLLLPVRFPEGLPNLA